MQNAGEFIRPTITLLKEDGSTTLLANMAIVAGLVLLGYVIILMAQLVRHRQWGMVAYSLVGFGLIGGAVWAGLSP